MWSQYRQQMLLDPTVTNLNTGSFGPLPACVFNRVTALRQRQAEEPMDFLLRQLPPLLWQARQRLAHFLGGKPERLVFTVNVSAAINMVASSLQLASAGEILLTDHEYLAMQWCWERAAQRLGLTLRTFPSADNAGWPGRHYRHFSGCPERTDAVGILQPRPLADRHGAAGKSIALKRAGAGC